MRQVDLGDAIQFILANPNDTRKVVRHTYRYGNALLDWQWRKRFLSVISTGLQVCLLRNPEARYGRTTS